MVVKITIPCELCHWLRIKIIYLCLTKDVLLVIMIKLLNLTPITTRSLSLVNASFRPWGEVGKAASKKVPPPGSKVLVIQKEISSGGRGSAEDFPLPRMNKKIQSAEGRGLAAVGRTSQFGLSVYDFIRVALL